MLKKIASTSFLIASLALFYSAVSVYAATSENASMQAQAIKMQRSTSSGQVRACEARMANVQNRSQNMLAHAQRLMNRIAAIETKVEEFYQNRLVAAGKEVEGYEDMQAQIQAKQRVVEMKMKETQDTADNFNCDNDPRGQVRAFGEGLREVVQAMKEYKTAVRTMLVAVHRVSLGVGGEEANGS